MIPNKYKILPVAGLDPLWFEIAVSDSVDDCTKSLDGSKVIIKLPVNIQKDKDVPEEVRQLYKANKPYLNHVQIRKEKLKPAWKPADDD